MNKNKTFWFRHDCDSIQDPSMMELLHKCGLAGIGLYWILAEIIHKEPEGKITKEAYKGYISMYSKFENQGASNFQQVFKEAGLFVEKNNFITSKRIQEEKKYMKKISKERSRAGKKSAEIRKKSKNNNCSTNVQQNSNKCATNTIQYKTKQYNSIATPSETAPKIPNLLQDKQRHIQIIGLFARAKGVEFDNKEKQQSFIKRNLRAAKDLTGYTNQRIIEVIDYLRKNADFKWTLETVGKFIDEDIIALDNQQKSNADIINEIIAR